MLLLFISYFDTIHEQWKQKNSFQPLFSQLNTKRVNSFGFVQFLQFNSFDESWDCEEEKLSMPITIIDSNFAKLLLLLRNRKRKQISSQHEKHKKHKKRRKISNIKADAAAVSLLNYARNGNWREILRFLSKEFLCRLKY